ncbi:hypothetical protein IM40_11435 (plasmid) [Candidatus Paracaedimonas acanthamoebae]|nr:hypothetical protein IM40_11435 [Candidatus Paracaedimonas acanthamoebae]
MKLKYLMLTIIKFIYVYQGMASNPLESELEREGNSEIVAYRTINSVLDEETLNFQVETPKYYYIKAVALQDEEQMQEAIEYFKLAAHSGHHRAAYILAHFYLEGKYLEKSAEEGMKYLIMSKDSGNLEAKQELDFIRNSIDELTEYLPESGIIKGLRKASYVAKKVESITWWLQCSGTGLYHFLDILGYNSQANFVENGLRYNQMINGVSKVVYGGSDSIVFGRLEPLLTSGLGIIQLGSIYLQSETLKQQKKLELKAQKLKNLKKENSEDYPSEWESIYHEKQQKIKEKKKVCDNQMIGVNIAENIMGTTLIAWAENKERNFLQVFLNSASKCFKVYGYQIISTILKETPIKEVAKRKVGSIIDNIRSNFSEALNSNSNLDKVFDKFKNEFYEYIDRYVSMAP